MGLFTVIIAHYPWAVLGAVAVFSMSCFFPLVTINLPNFKDPQLGFEARGTEIAKRLKAWHNLVEAVGPPGGNKAGLPNRPLTVDPLWIGYMEQKPSSKDFSFPFSINKTGRGTGNELETEKLNIFANISLVIEPADNRRNRTEAEDDSEEDWESLRDELSAETDSHHDHDHLSPDAFFCNRPNEEYGRLVVSARWDGVDLFSLNSVLELCRLESVLTAGGDGAHFPSICEAVAKARCCPPWSLPNYIAMLNNRSSCMDVTKHDVEKTRRLVEFCHRYYFDLTRVADFKTRDIPQRCRYHNAAYNMMHFILDFEFKNSSTPLLNVMIILPIARSSAALDYYNSLDLSALRMENIEVTAIDFGLKEMLFDEYLLRDAQLILVGAGFVLVSMWFYTGSLFVTCMTLVAITFSLGISYFFYTLIFRIKFFPFMNLLATVVAVGVGGDASLMMCKVWSCAKSSRQGEGGTAAGGEVTLASLVNASHRHSTLCALVSALTTAAAFYSSYVTSITAICCFSIFAGTAVVANFFVMIGWVPACLVISERWLPSLPWPPPGSDAVVRCTRTAVIWAVLRLRYLWIAALGTLALVAAIAVLYRPRLRLPDTPDLQLFSADHPFERYHLEYKQRFWFERLKRLGSGDAESRLPLRFVWGVVAEDNGDHMDPASMGHLQLDPTFDLSAPESQLWLLSFCSKLRAQPFYQSTVGPLLPNCFLEAFVGWMRQRCSDPIHPGWTRAPCCEKNKFPYGRRVFSKCLPRAASSLYGTPAELSMPGMAGPKFSVEPAQNGIHKLKALVVEYDSNYSHTTSYVEMDRFYRQVETWTRAQMSTAPPGMRNGWFVSDLGLYDVQGCLQTDTIAAAAVSVAVAFLVVLATTLDPVLGLVAVTTIAATIFVTVATLIAIGWRLNVLEAVAVSVAIGLAVDFSVHYVVNYKMAPDKDKRESAVEYALSMMAGPTLMAALTTGVTGALMLPSQVLAYTQIGVFLVVVMTVSWVYATLFMGSVLAVVGPQGGSGGSSLVNWRRRRGCRGGRRRGEGGGTREHHEMVGGRRRRGGTPATDRSPSAASATTIIHDDELVVLQPQELVALTITPSADRPS